jgi:hypothetical protein
LIGAFSENAEVLFMAFFQTLLQQFLYLDIFNLAIFSVNQTAQNITKLKYKNDL